MRRRAFLASVAAAAVGGACAQEKPRIVVLHPASVESSAVYQRLVPGLAKLGHVEGKTVTLDLRSANGVASALPKLVQDAVAARPRAMVVVGPAAVGAAVAATRTVPIVAIDLESDPVAEGWVRSLPRPGGNVTGLFLDFLDMSVKRLQILREVMPNLRDVAFLWDTSTGRAQLAAAEKAAAEASVASRTIAIDDWTQFADIMATSLRPRPQALVVLQSPIAFQYSVELATFAKGNRVPAISPFRRFADAGGLMSYGPDLDLFFARAADILDRILRGTSPADVAARLPEKYEMVLNEPAARALDLRFPRELELRADDVIR